MAAPEAGPVIRGTGGLRKARFHDAGRGKGKRGGLRIVYYWWRLGSQFWLFTVYDKDQKDDLTQDQRAVLRALLDAELSMRRSS